MSDKVQNAAIENVAVDQLRKGLIELVNDLFDPKKASMEARYLWSGYLLPSAYVTFTDKPVSKRTRALDASLNLPPITRGFAGVAQEQSKLQLDGVIDVIETIWEKDFGFFLRELKTDFDTIWPGDVRYKWAKLYEDWKKTYNVGEVEEEKEEGQKKKKKRKKEEEPLVSWLVGAVFSANIFFSFVRRT